MADVRDRLTPLEGLEAPDLWEQVRTRQPMPLLPEHRRTDSRIAVISIAFALSIAAIGFVVIAFSAEPPMPAQPAPRQIENGDIWVKVGGGDAETAIYRVDPDQVRNSEAMWADDDGTFGGATVAPELVADDYAFSPDGTRVVFSAPGGGGDGQASRELFVMDVDGSGLTQLTDDGAYAGFPAWSPDGTTIAYATYHGSDYVPGCLGTSACPTDLYLVYASGGATQLLIGGEASETTPTWSPNGSTVAFAEIDLDGSGVIATIQADGSHRIDVSPRGKVSFPGWSPDGRQILFMINQDGSNHIWTMNADGSGSHDLVDTRTDTNFGRPLWSPAGDLIAFARPYAGVVSLWIIDPSGDLPPQRLAGWPGFAGQPIAWRPVLAEPESTTPVAQIATGATPPTGAIVFTSSQKRRSSELVYTVPGTGTVTPMTDARSHGLVASGAAWSPDGSRVAFVVGTPDSWRFTGDGDLYVMDADGSNIRRLPVDAVTSPTWSSDGQRLAFVRDQGTSLWVINEDGSDPHVIAQDRGYYQGPAWSPTEDVIAFQSRVDAARDLTAIFTIRSDGSHERLVTPEGVNSGSPAWSPDGTHLAYSGPSEELRILDLSSGDSNPITRCSGFICPADFAPEWSPDGTQIVFVRQESKGSMLNLYILDVSTGSRTRLAPDLGSVGGPTWRP